MSRRSRSGGATLAAVLATGLIAAALAATGVLGGGDEESGKSDEDQITEVVEDTLENYDDPDICDNWTDDYHETVEGGKDNCAPELELNSEQDFEVGDIQVDGDEATAEVEIDGDNEEIELKKEDDEWLIDNEVAGVCCVGGFAENGTTSEDGGGTASGSEAEVRNVVEQWLSAIQTNNGTQFCANVTYNFMREHGVRGQDDQLTGRCENQADRIINDLIIASDPDVATIDVPSDSGFQTAKVTLTDTSKLDVVGEPGEYWLIDTFV
jgi:hypothetical protein